MAKKTKELFKVDGDKIMVYDIVALAEDPEAAKKFRAYKTLGYEIVEVKPEPKKRNTFTIEKAQEYIKAHDKKGLKSFASIKDEAATLADEYRNLKAAEKKAKATDATEEDKKAAPTAEEVKAAQRAMITAQRTAFAAQKKYFKEKYGEEAYNEVRMM